MIQQLVIINTIRFNVSGEWDRTDTPYTVRNGNKMQMQIYIDFFFQFYRLLYDARIAIVQFDSFN